MQSTGTFFFRKAGWKLGRRTFLVLSERLKMLRHSQDYILSKENMSLLTPYKYYFKNKNIASLSKKYFKAFDFPIPPIITYHKQGTAQFCTSKLLKRILKQQNQVVKTFEASCFIFNPTWSELECFTPDCDFQYLNCQAVSGSWKGRIYN